MTRQECEEKLIALAREMYETYKAYNPTHDFLGMYADKNGYICVDDVYFTPSNKVILDANGGAFKTVYVVQFSDGCTCFGNGKRVQS